MEIGGKEEMQAKQRVEVNNSCLPKASMAMKHKRFTIMRLRVTAGILSITYYIIPFSSRRALPTRRHRCKITKKSP